MGYVRSAVFFFDTEHSAEDAAEELGAFDHDDLHKMTRLSDDFALFHSIRKVGKRFLSIR